jgi:putative peptidoglycan lipid II flippase
MNSPKKFAGLGFVVTVNLVLQFLFQWYVITFLGVNMQTDALFGAMALPQFILIVLSGSLTMVLIPIIASFSGDKFLEESWNYFQGVGLVFASISILLLMSAQWWVAWILPGFKTINYQLAVSLARIQVLAMLFSALLSVVWAIHSAKSNFLKIEYSSIIANIISFVLMIILIKPTGIYAVAWVSVLRVLLQVFFLMKIMGSYRKPNFHSPSFKLAWQKLKPLMAGNAYYKTDTLVDRFLTSKGTSGELTLLNLAQQLYMTANSILVKVLVNTMVPEMAKAHASGDEKRYNHILKKRLIISFVCTIISFLAVLIIGQWVLSFIFSFKKFTVQDVYKLWWLLVLLVGYLIGGLTGSITSSAFYAKGDTVTPTRIGTVLFTLYIPVKIFCYVKFGIGGLAISISAYYIISFLLQLFFLRKHLF